MKKFDLGSVVLTANVSGNPFARLAIPSLLGWHSSGDYGHASEEDIRSNEHALANPNAGGRVLSIYKVPNDFEHNEVLDVWVFTENLGSREPVTTILYPKDYEK